MKKGQIEILNNAKRFHLPEDEIQFLSREDYTINQLRMALHYFQTNDFCKSTELIKECEAYLDYIDNYLERYIFLPEHDKFIGNRVQKRRFHKFSQFLLYKENPNSFYGINDYVNLYRISVYKKLPRWNINVLLHSKADVCNLISYTIAPEISEEFITRGEDSFLYLIASKTNTNSETNYLANNTVKDIIAVIKPFVNKGEMDWRKLFHFDEKGYISNINYPVLWELLEKSNPLKYEFYKYITSYYKKYNYPVQPGSVSYPTLRFFLAEKDFMDVDKKRIQEFSQAVTILNKKFTIEEPMYNLGIKIGLKKSIYIKYEKYLSAEIIPDAGNLCFENFKISGKGIPSVAKIVIFDDGDVYYELNRTKKLIPMPLSKFFDLWIDTNSPLHPIMNIILQKKIKENLIYKDLARDYQEVKLTIPINFNEVSKYHNKAELLKAKYKLANNLKIKWNRQNIFLSYLIIKSYPKLANEKSRQILLQQKDISLIPNYECGYLKNSIIINDFLINLILRLSLGYDYNKLKTKIQEECDEEISLLQENYLKDEYEEWVNSKKEDTFSDCEAEISDYLKMCKTKKKKIRLDFYDFNQVINEHNLLSNEYRKYTKKVTIPKDSIFIPLRKILPKEFEWITTRKRLILETELQHHCVWSYADYISQDECAIYSYVDKTAEHGTDKIPKRYTIEFRYDKRERKYYVNQVQGKYDRVNASKMVPYIQFLLDKFVE